MVCVLLDANALQAWVEADGDTGDLRGRPEHSETLLLLCFCLIILMLRRSISEVVFVALGCTGQVDAGKRSLHLSSLCPSSAEQDLETEDGSARSDPMNSIIRCSECRRCGQQFSSQ